MCKHFSKHTSKVGNVWPPVGGAINMTQKLYVDVVIASIIIYFFKNLRLLLGCVPVLPDNKNQMTRT